MEPLPEDVTGFLYNHVESIDQLEILRVLGEDPAKEWDAVALADAVQARSQSVRDHLVRMHARGLLVTTNRGTDLFCRHGASTPDLRNMVAQVLQLYKERPVTMIKKVYEQARDPLRAFANAFRIRRES